MYFLSEHNCIRLHGETKFLNMDKNLNIQEIKKKFHILIDSSNDEDTLNLLYEISLFKLDKAPEINLTVDEKKSLLESYRDSENEEELLSNECVKEMIKNGIENSMDKKSLQ